MSVLQQTVGAVRAADGEAAQQAWRRQHAVTEPPAPLGGPQEPGAGLPGSDIGAVALRALAPADVTDEEGAP